MSSTFLPRENADSIAFLSDALVASSVKAASAAFSSIVFFSAAVMPYFFSI